MADGQEMPPEAADFNALLQTARDSSALTTAADSAALKGTALAPNDAQVAMMNAREFLTADPNTVNFNRSAIALGVVDIPDLDVLSQLTPPNPNIGQAIDISELKLG